MLFKNYMFLVALLALAPVSSALFCYVGEEGAVKIKGGFDYCVSIRNMRTVQDSYVGGYGENRMFERVGNASQNRCFSFLVIDLPNEISCFCNRSLCNTVLSFDAYADKVSPFW